MEREVCTLRVTETEGESERVEEVNMVNHASVLFLVSVHSKIVDPRNSAAV